MLPFTSWLPESTRGFLRRGAGVGASPDIHEGKGVELIAGLATGTALDFFGPKPIISLPPRTYKVQQGVPSHLRWATLGAC